MKSAMTRQQSSALQWVKECIAAVLPQRSLYQVTGGRRAGGSGPASTGPEQKLLVGLIKSCAAGRFLLICRMPGLKLILVLLLLAPALAYGSNCPKPISGTLDLSHFPDCLNDMEISGEWLLGQGRRPAQWHKIQIPGSWNSILSPQDHGTYRLTIIIPQNVDRNATYAIKTHFITSSFQVFVNGKLVGERGRPAASAGDTLPDAASMVSPFSILEDSAHEIVLELYVANFNHANGGIRTRLFLGTYSRLDAARNQALAMDGALAGSILLMGLYHIILFLKRKLNLALLYFGFFCIFISVYSSCSGEHLLHVLFPDITFMVRLKIEYLSIAIALPLFLAYLNQLLPVRPGNAFVLIAIVLESAYGLFVVALPGEIFSRFLFFQHGMIVAATVYSVCVILFQLNKTEDSNARTLLVGGIIFGATVIHDLLNNRNIIASIPLSGPGFVAFIFVQAYLLARIFSDAFEEISSLSGKLKHTNSAFSRFVPHELLRQLNVSDITEVQLGDQVQKDMTVLFCDIVGFTALSESMSPRDNFNFLNSYLKCMAPIIEKNHGFIDKYLGDAIMALFPAEPAHAVLAAREMLLELEKYNETRKSQNYVPIRIGIGLHTGPLMLGTIGSESRMDGTVISDTVNIAARLQEFTREWHVDVLTTEAVVSGTGVQNASGLIRLAGELAVKGKTHEVLIYQLDFTATEETMALRESTRGQFEAASLNYAQGLFLEARRLFGGVLERDPEDTIARWYIGKIDSRTTANS